MNPKKNIKNSHLGVCSAASLVGESQNAPSAGNSMSSVDFASLGIAAPVLKAVKQLGYEQPSPVQAASIPILLAGKNFWVLPRPVLVRLLPLHCLF